MHCGYLSLCHNCNTNCRNVSLTITETSTNLVEDEHTDEVFSSSSFSYSSSVRGGGRPTCARRRTPLA